MIRAVPYEYYEIFFYRHFPDPGGARTEINGAVKAKLVDGLRLILMHFMELRS